MSEKQSCCIAVTWKNVKILNSLLYCETLRFILENQLDLPLSHTVLVSRSGLSQLKCKI